jgi:SAM-dependent methyltransferase
MSRFVRVDGRVVRVVRGFRDRVLASRPSCTPRPHWTAADFTRAAETKRKRAARLVSEIDARRGGLDGAAVLDVGCGDGTTCLVLAGRGVAAAVGVDLELPLFAPDERGARARRLAALLLEQGSLVDVLTRGGVRFVRGDATRLSFADDSFDVLLSRSAMEHIVPVERALVEMARVVRPGGLIHHGIDPFYWLRGCHKRGLVDIPWAHARLSREEFRRFVLETEGEAAAAQRCHRLDTLNRLTLAEWRAVIEAGPFEILDWREEPSTLACALLDEFPDVRDSLAPGVGPRDLVHGRLEVWLRVKKASRS